MYNTKSHEITIRPIIGYPREAEIGKTYLMTVDVQAVLEGDWPYVQEEYALHCILDAAPLFSHESLGESTIVLNRFGGTYGPATFLLTANNIEQVGEMRISLLRDGLLVQTIRLDGIQLVKKSQRKRKPPLVLPRGSIYIPYRPDLYVPRAEAEAKVQSWLKGSDRLLTITSPPATGKSWLLKRIEAEMLNGMPVFWLDVRDFLAPVADSPIGSRIIDPVKLAGWLSQLLQNAKEKCIGIPLYDADVETAVLLEKFAEAIFRCYPGQQAYLLVEGGDEPTEDAWRIIERQVLEPIAWQTNWRFIIVLRQERRLSSYILRPFEQRVTLSIFSDAGRQQIERLRTAVQNRDLPNIQAIFSVLPGYTWSHPGLNNFLFIEVAANYQRHSTEWLGEDSGLRGLQAITGLPLEYVQRLYTYLLAIINQLDEAWVPEDLVTVFNWPMTKTWQAIEELRSAGLVEKNTNKTFFKIIDGVREFVRGTSRMQRDRLPLQDWLPDIPLPPDTVARSPFEQTPLLSILKKDPLLHSRAEDELSSLFGLGAFWIGHPLYTRIATATQSQVVVGARGSGRTALARALCYYESQEKHHYWVYLSVLATQPTVVSDLRPMLAEHLLQYTLSKPTLLSNLPDAALKLLGRLLAQALSPFFVLAKIERAIHHGGWYERAEDHQKENWRAVGETQLQLLAGCIEADAQLPEAQWPRAYVECLRALSFRGLRLVLDVSGSHAESFAALNAALVSWEQAGAQVTIFLPQESLAARQQHDAGRQVLEQAWTAEQLQALLIHRFRKLAQRDLASVFSEEAEVAFVQAVKTPREMFTLWTTILQTVKEWPDPPQILPGHTEQAQQNVVAIMPEHPDVRQRQEAQEFIIPQIEQYFSEEELRILCNNFGMNYEDLPGENFSLKVQEMVEYLLRKSHFPELLEALRRQQEKKYAEIAGKVENYFSPEELRVLCYDLGVKYENLPGETFSLKVRGVVDYMVRYGRFSELIELLKKERPSLSW